MVAGATNKVVRAGYIRAPRTSCAAPGSSPGVLRASMSSAPAMPGANTWMPRYPDQVRVSAGMTKRGSVRTERTPRDESEMRRPNNLMRDSLGLGGILRDKVGLSETSGIPRQRFLPESCPSARPTCPSSRTQRAWTVRRAPQHPSHAMPHAVMRGHARTRYGYPRIHLATPPATTHSLAHVMALPSHDRRTPCTAPWSGDMRA